MEINSNLKRAKFVLSHHVKVYPDLSRIENVWRILKHKMPQRRPRTVAHLKTCLQEEWHKITPETLHLVSSVPKYLSVVLILCPVFLHHFFFLVHALGVQLCSILFIQQYKIITEKLFVASCNQSASPFTLSNQYLLQLSAVSSPD